MGRRSGPGSLRPPQPTAIFAGDLTGEQTIELIDRWCSKASCSRLAPFVTVAKTIRKHRDGILSAIRLKINNARAEGLNNHVRLIIRRAYGFHSPTAALALVMLPADRSTSHYPTNEQPRDPHSCRESPKDPQPA